ncbi:MAG TPA: autotransporter-associated beta strand repeat-containing protein [Verrucomicrobiae bacterium]|nr:autotransporter-associated beta strand repeat-containing protein [Verrucomicrobiae bacterium]
MIIRIITLLALLPLASLLSSPSCADNLVWTGAADGLTWDNSTVANWYDTDKAYATNFTAGDNVTFDDSSANNLINVADTLQPGSVTVSASSVDYIFGGGGDITGATGLTKSGARTLSIQADNDYSGPTTISGGTLEISAGGTIGTGNVTDNGVLAFANVNIFPNNISGTGIVTNEAASTLVLTGTNTFTGNVYNGSLGQTGNSFLIVSNSSDALDGVSQVTLAGGQSNLKLYTPVDGSQSLSIPAHVGLTMLIGNGAANRGILLVYPSVIGNTNLCTWNGPITIKGDGTLNGVVQIGPQQTARLTVNGDVTASSANNFSGQCGFVGAGTNTSGIMNGHVSLNANADLLENNVAGASGNYNFGSWTFNSDSGSNTCDGIWILGGILMVGVDNAMPVNSPWVFANGTETATLDLNGHNQQIAGLVNHASAGGAAIITNSSPTLSTLTYSNGTGSFVISSVSALFANGFRSSTFTNFTGNIVGNLGLTVAGGTLNLQSSNTYFGNTIITNGATLMLTGSGSISNNANVAIASGATVVLSIRTNSTPNNNITAATIVYGGTLIVTNVGSLVLPAQGTNVFHLFNGAISGSFTSVILPALSAGEFWITNNLNVDGTISLVNNISPVNPNPTNIVFSASGGNLALSWPADHTGWTLQSQTNGLSVGISTNWANVANSSTTNQVVMPINPANGTVFYRLMYQQ